MKTKLNKTFWTQALAALMIVTLLLTAMPVQSASAAAATYNFQTDNGTTVATGITTNDGTCGSNATAYTRTLMTTTAQTCNSERVEFNNITGNMLDVWFNTAYAASTNVTGTSLKIRLRENQGGPGSQSFTAAFRLMYVNASGTITDFGGAEATQIVGNNVDQDFTINLSTQSATIPAGSKLGIRIRLTANNSSSARVYYGSGAGATGGASGVLIVDETPAVHHHHGGLEPQSVHLRR